MLAKLSAPQAKFKKKTVQTGILGTFWKILTKKLRFFGARSKPKYPPPLKISIYWRRNYYSSKLDFLKSTKGGPFGSAGGPIPEGKSSAVPLPPPHQTRPWYNGLQSYCYPITNFLEIESISWYVRQKIRDMWYIYIIHFSWLYSVVLKANFVSNSRLRQVTGFGV